MWQRIGQALGSAFRTAPVRSKAANVSQRAARAVQRDVLRLSSRARSAGSAVGAVSEGLVVGLRREGAVAAKASGQAAPLPDLHALIPDAPQSAIQLRRGGFKKLYAGNRVQGSDIVGGTQPSFLIERDSKPIRQLLEEARVIGNSSKPLWQKVENIQSRVRRSIRFPADKTEAKALEALNRKHLMDAIGIGEYHRLGLADCRGFAVTTQMMLQEARIDAFFGYGKTFYQGAPGVDHAFNVVRDKGKLIVVDTLNPIFNKVPLETMLTKGAHGYRFELHPVLPFVYTNPAKNLAPVLDGLAAS